MLTQSKCCCSQIPEALRASGISLHFEILEFRYLDAVRDASEACDQAVVIYGAWSKRAKQRRNAPNS